MESQTNHPPPPARSALRLLLVGVCLLLPLSFSAALPGAPDELGLPFLTMFYPDDYNGMGQNWDIVQDERGLMYLANGDGVFEFDGVNWRWLEPEYNRTARSIAAGPGRQVFVGYHGEIGRFAPDSTGEMAYQSLTPLLADSLRDFRDVWITLVHDDRVYFAALAYMFSWRVDEGVVDTASFQLFEPSEEGRFQALTSIRNRLHVIDTERGVLEIVDDELTLLPGTKDLPLWPIWSILPFRTDELLLLGYEGIHRVANGRTSPWNTPISAFARETEAYSASYLGQGYYALGTDNRGLVLFDEEGAIRRVVDHDLGLANNQVFNYPYLDREGGVWVCLDYGLARIELLSPLQRYNHTLNLKGGVLDIQRFDGQLLVGTSQGLYYPNAPGEPGMPVTFTAVDSISSAWRIQQLDNQILIADENHLKVTTDPRRTPRSLLEHVGPFSIAIDSARARAFVGCAAGPIYALSWRAGRWQDEGQIADLEQDVSWLTFAPDGALWANYGFDTLRYARIEFERTEPLKVAEVRRFTESDGYLEATPGRPFLFDGEFLLSAWRGLYRWDMEQDSLILATDHPLHALAVEETINMPAISPHGRLWFENEDGICRLATLRDDGGITLESPLRRTPRTGYNMFAVENGTLWAGMVGLHLVRYDLHALDLPSEPSVPVLIRTVTSGDSTLAIGAVAHLAFEESIPYSHNTLRFEYALPAYDNITRNQYQTRLVGYEDEWTDWTDDSYHPYSNLPPGLYRFEVRARDANGTLSPVSTAEFRIAPPWYATWWAILIGIVVSGGSGFLLVRWRIATIEQRNIRLDRLVRERTDELDRVRASEREAEIRMSQMETAYKMAATVAHEFNNPLAIIHASSQLMQQEEFDADRVRELGRKIPPQVNRLRDLLQRILTVEELKEIDYAAGMTILDIHGEDNDTPARSLRLTRDGALYSPLPDAPVKNNGSTTTGSDSATPATDSTARRQPGT